MTALEELEARLKKLHTDCGRQSGMPAFPRLDEQRKELLREVEKQRVLTRWEFICLYGYTQWREFVDQAGLPENHPVAKNRFEIIRADLEPEIERWDDPGDYPSNAGSGPLPSYDYVEEISGEVHVKVEGKPPLKDGVVSNGDIEEYEPELLDALLKEVPNGITVQKWNLTVKDQILELQVNEFEACDWEPPEPPEDW